MRGGEGIAGGIRSGILVVEVLAGVEGGGYCPVSLCSVPIHHAEHCLAEAGAGLLEVSVPGGRSSCIIDS